MHKELEKTKLELEKWKYYAQRDDMTEILNRREGIILLSQEIELTKETKKPLTICFVDIDELKKVNDTFGHIEGDNLIIDAVNIIKDNIRKYDIAFRFAGDEFIIIFPNTNMKSAEEVWNRIRGKIDSFNKTAKKYKIGLSYGIVEYPLNKNLSVNDYIKLADKKMYQFKNLKH
ncbi:hypothetical protein BHF68_09080 [Desulfuribacillus alkaliarsenatis]|uniref:GGDEF domain-containing protein n=2 Tax=Desulfuribacillus alkaliarsenatis TaxID=766136 RepID=A0A1E5G0N4_9FIRM|nr:hypothetical protein BHF68_09080 [Desulfuribacillus alkaliarsenatis]